MKKVLLAFSGGLDTSYCVKYLSRELGMEVHTATVNTGGFSVGEIAAIELRALTLGAQSHTTLDETNALYEQCLRFLIFGNVLKNNSYPLSVSAERVFQARAIANLAAKMNVEYVAHGSTGAGNDQVRFDVVFHSLIPHIHILTPIRDQKLSRDAEILYLQSCSVAGDWTKALYSINQGLWGTTIGGKETLTSHLPLPEDAYPSHCTQTDEQQIALRFVQGELKGIDNELFDHPVLAIQALKKLAEPFAIGRDIHVGDTIIGIKGRVGFEAAAPMIIIKAHHSLEKHTLTKWQLNLKEQLALWYGQLLHEGLFSEPALRAIEAFFLSTQQTVSGEVFVCLAPYRFIVEGIKSPHDLMSSQFGTYGEMNAAWSGADVEGYARIAANQSLIFNSVNGDL